MSLDLTDDEPILVQLMAWYHQAPLPMLTQIFVAIWRHWATMSKLISTERRIYASVLQVSIGSDNEPMLTYFQLDT